MDRKRLIVIIIVIVLLILGVIFYFTARQAMTATTNTADTATVSLRTDPDTGEHTTTDPSLGTSESEDAKETTLLGVEVFITKTNATRPQVLYLRDALHTYATTTLKGQYATLTIRPQDFVVSGDTATSTLRLGDTDTFVNFAFKGLQNGTLTVTITDPTGKNGGNFASTPQQYFESD